MFSLFGQLQQVAATAVYEMVNTLHIEMRAGRQMIWTSKNMLFVYLH
jgi:hypothetical protein